MDDKTPEEKFIECYKKDPFPNIVPALLNSADIKKYIERVGVVEPFNEEYEKERLKGATYEVGIGNEVVWWDNKTQKRKVKDLSENDPYFDLEPNSIMFIELDTMFRIPTYMIMRFNLKIKHVYKGLLLGTGPIVDPGFVGKLSIPLHNLTANKYTFKKGDLMIAMEFTKLSPNELWIPDRDSLCFSVGQEKYIENKIPHNRSIFDCIFNAIGSNQMVKSSIPKNIEDVRNEIERTQKDFVKTKKTLEKKVSSIQIITVVAVMLSIISVVVTTVSILSYAFTSIKEIGNVYKENDNAYVNKIINRVERLEKRIDDLSNENNNLKDIEQIQMYNKDSGNETKEN